MLIPLLRKLCLTGITFIVLSVISYHISLRNPMNGSLSESEFQQYWQYMTELFQGHLGFSETTGNILIAQILAVFPATLSLCLSATLLSLIIGVSLGFVAAYWRNQLFGRFLIALGSLSLAVPVFWLALVLLYYSAVNQWQIASVGELNMIYEVKPITGFQLIDILLSDSPYKLKMIQSALHHLALPTLVLSLPAILEMMKATQERTTYVLNQNYVKASLMRGWSIFKLWRTQIFRNTIPALIPNIARNMILIFAFGLLIENIFSWPGIGRWMIKALELKDYNMISAGVMVIGIFVLLVDFITSFVIILLDPSRKKGWYD